MGWEVGLENTLSTDLGVGKRSWEAWKTPLGRWKTLLGGLGKRPGALEDARAGVVDHTLRGWKTARPRGLLPSRSDSQLEGVPLLRVAPGILGQAPRVPLVPYPELELPAKPVGGERSQVVPSMPGRERGGEVTDLVLEQVHGSSVECVDLAELPDPAKGIGQGEAAQGSADLRVPRLVRVDPVGGDDDEVGVRLGQVQQAAGLSPLGAVQCGACVPDGRGMMCWKAIAVFRKVSTLCSMSSRATPSPSSAFRIRQWILAASFPNLGSRKPQRIAPWTFT